MVLTILTGSVIGVRQARGIDASGAPKTNVSPMLAAPRATGNPAAKIRVVEFIDYQCPSCAKSAYFLDELSKRHPQDLYVEVKYFPLKSHAHGMTTAKIIECSRMQGKFWEAHKAVLLSQPLWRDLEQPRPVIDQALQAANVDTQAIDRCIADPQIERAILGERDEALRLNLRSTPTFFVNGTMIVGYIAMRAEMAKLFPDAESIQVPADNVAPPDFGAAQGQQVSTTVMKAQVLPDGTVQIGESAGGANGS